MVRATDFTVDGGYQTAKELLANPRGFDYISCATDTIAAGVIKAIREYYGSISSPKAPRVSGFGDDPILQAVAGPIPSVRFDYEECGIKTAEIMVDQLKDRTKLAVSLVLGYQVVGV